jgi:alkylation response protein AidB-like acyl-CoA dehydrogenase
MIPTAHPSYFIQPTVVDLIRERAVAAEKTGQLHPDQLSVIYSERWFNLFVPATYHGLALSLPEGLQIEEALAWVDGSTGWTVTLCSGANWFIGFLQTQIAETLFKNEEVCLAGSGKPSGTATILQNGYEISGSWNYATGASHATAFTANCLLEKEGVIQQHPDGSPLIRAFVFLKDEVKIYPDWNAFGMIATSSHRFEVSHLRVGSERCVLIEGSKSNLPQSIYRFPFEAFAVATLSVNCSGMGCRFLQLCREVFLRSSSHHLLLPLEKAIQQLEAARTAFYTCLTASWEIFVKQNQISDALLAQIMHTSRSLAATALRLSDELFPFCGMAAANPDTELNRVWRNLHTASLHHLLNTASNLTNEGSC